MTALFDGLASLLAGAFGAPVTIRRSPADVTVQAIFAQSPVMTDHGDGRERVELDLTCRFRRDGAVPVPGEIIAPAAAAGRAFRVLQVLPPASPAADALVTCILEEVAA